MISFDNSENAKNATKYYCEKCNFKCSKKSNFAIHCSTRKHLNDNNAGINDNNLDISENNKLYMLEPSFNSKVEEKKVNNYTFIIDSTPVNKIEVQSQLPLSYIIRETVVNVCGGQGSKDTTLNVETIDNKVVGFYFLCKEQKVDFSNQFFKEDLNEFLAVLF